MSLRSWQTACIAAALDTYRSKSHFLCMATPGAGKTVMAATVASRLLRENKIDFIFCFAPSKTVVESIKATFTSVLGNRFDGFVGSVGGAYTYQAMSGFESTIWQVLQNKRALVIFDEIHHCAGHGNDGLNAWGHEIVKHVRNNATYTLALSGTPWRSDHRPIVLSQYEFPQAENEKIRCDFSYGLQQAIDDEVCRIPSVVLIDNDQLSYRCGDTSSKYSGLPELFEETDVTYQAVLNNEKALIHCLSLACKRLDLIRKTSPNAAGLVVASSIKHAVFIAELLRVKLKENPIVVSHTDPMANRTIEKFRSSDKRWIVSVGMISEGTDIPRLQVCCHLSRVKTELYFRQVLGRILRRLKKLDRKAWLYTFAEPQLMEFAKRLTEEVPDSEMDFVLSPASVVGKSTKRNLGDVESPELLDWHCNDHEDQDIVFNEGLVSKTRDFLTGGLSDSDTRYTLDCLGRFRETILQLS